MHLSHKTNFTRIKPQPYAHKHLAVRAVNKSVKHLIAAAE